MAKSKKPTQIDALKHKTATRKNIPTEELRDFLKDDGDQPATMLYPRDPSLDPQLVWKGKDEQDARPLEVPVVPIYIQEKIHPQAIVDDVRRRGGKRPDEQQLDLFADFNGLHEFDKKIDFYNHDQHWSNRMILGDSLLVMTSLAEKEGLKGQVQMIYIDPPYGINFGSNWQVSTRQRDVKDAKPQHTTRQPEQVRAFRDTWKLGIHSYLSYLRDRFAVGRELLADSGSIFVQIGNENVHLVRSVLDEVFGPENFCMMITFKKTSGAGSFAGGTNILASVSDYILWYVKEAETPVKYRQLFHEKAVGGLGGAQYTWIEDENGDRHRLGREEGQSERMVGRRFRGDNLTSQTVREAQTTVFDVAIEGGSFRPGKGGWKTNRDGMNRLILAHRLFGQGQTLSYLRYIDDFPLFPIVNIWDDTVTSGFADPKSYVVQTNPKVIERCMMMSTDPGELVLDPTCGSGSTAFVAEQRGRRWITIDTSRVALALARTRLMAARYPYYLLADSPAGVRKEAEITGQTPPAYPTHCDIRKGFVYQRVPHVMLKHIANNEEIDTIHDKWQAKLEPLREKLNKACKATWEDWEIPREPEDGWTKSQRELIDEWWTLRRKRQREIDDSIARHADQELLYDKPYEDNSIVRVTGPFTVESISPHRSISVEEKQRRATPDPRDGRTVRLVGPDDFGHMIIENIRKAGIQNQYKDERLKFDTLDPFAGEWIHAVGEYTTKDGKTKRVAVCIGPEHGTVGPDLIKEAAKEAVKGVGFDLLVVCGFAFDPHANEETKRYGKLEVQVCRMNPDLAMGDDLLKKTGAGNLFMIFGEPDVEIRREKPKKNGKKSAAAAEQVTVEIRGVDVYDPTTGVVRSNSTDDIACWFIDTDYDGESFFVRHAYFTGAGEPYDKLKRALRAEVDEDAWSSLYSTVSQPFPVPSTGKIAVKVINHYGDEVLKVYEVK